MYLQSIEKEVWDWKLYLEKGTLQWNGVFFVHLPKLGDFTYMGNSTSKFFEGGKSEEDWTHTICLDVEKTSFTTIPVHILKEDVQSKNCLSNKKKTIITCPKFIAFTGWG